MDFGYPRRPPPPLGRRRASSRCRRRWTGAVR